LPEQAGSPPEVSADEPVRNLARWLAVLDELETELAAVHDGGRTAAAWTAPKDLGPIPAELVDRAARLAAAQQEAIAALQAAVQANRRQSAFLDAVPKATGPAAAAYLDVSA
jgi:hypothetical protein